MESKKFGTGGNVNYTYGGKNQINKQRTRGGSIYGVQKNIPNENLNKYVGKKAGGEVKHEDIKMDKKVVKKAVAMHDKQLHGGKKTDLKGLKKGGMTAGKAAHAVKEGKRVAKEMEYDYKTGKKSFRGTTAQKDAHAEKEGRKVAKAMEYDYSKGREMCGGGKVKKMAAGGKVKKMFGGGMGMASGMGAGKLPAPSATNAAGNAAIGRATGITPPTGGPRGSAPTPAPNPQQTGAGSRMMESMMRAKEASAGRAPARQMGSVPAPKSTIANAVRGAVSAPTSSIANTVRGAAKGANPLAGKKAPSQGRRMAKGGLAAGHKAADGIAKKGKTKGTEVKMARGGKTKKYC